MRNGQRQPAALAGKRLRYVTETDERQNELPDLTRAPAGILTPEKLGLFQSARLT